MKKQQGVSLIELVVFITVLAIALPSVMVVLTTSLQQSAIPEKIGEALSTTQGRMEIILGNNHFTGYSTITSLTDICASSTTGICSQGLTGYTVSSSITQTTLNTTDTNYAIVTVNTAAAAGTPVQLKSLVAGYP